MLVAGCWLLGRGGVEGCRRTIVHGGGRSHRLASGWPSSQRCRRREVQGKATQFCLVHATGGHFHVLIRVRGDTSAAGMSAAVRRGARIDWIGDGDAASG